MASNTSDYSLALGDDALIAAQRLAEWITRAPQIEEDVALANIGLDLLGQARMLLTYAGSLLTPTQTEDDLANLRNGEAFRNTLLVERVNGDFAVTMARLLLLSGYQAELYAGLLGSTDATLAAIAAKAVKEVAYHRDHAAHWVVRLGDGTEESHARMQAGLEAEWPFLAELFEADWVGGQLLSSGVATNPAALQRPALGWVREVLAEAGLTEPDPGSSLVTGGRIGVHTDALDELLADMQQVARAHPGASW